jgi:hypothetical protein
VAADDSWDSYKFAQGEALEAAVARDLVAAYECVLAEFEGRIEAVDRKKGKRDKVKGGHEHEIRKLEKKLEKMARPIWTSSYEAYTNGAPQDEPEPQYESGDEDYGGEGRWYGQCGRCDRGISQQSCPWRKWDCERCGEGQDDRNGDPCFGSFAMY